MAMPDDDIAALEQAFIASEQDARTLVDGLSESHGTWQPKAGSWSVAECLDHLATGNRVYLDAMSPSAERALTEGRLRRGPAMPGLVAVVVQQGGTAAAQRAVDVKLHAAHDQAAAGVFVGSHRA